MRKGHYILLALSIAALGFALLQEQPPESPGPIQNAAIAPVSGQYRAPSIPAWPHPKAVSRTADRGDPDSGESAAEVLPSTARNIGTSTDAAAWLRRFYPDLARIQELETLTADEAIAEVLPMLSAADPVVRHAAVESLADSGHPARLSMLAIALYDSVAQIRATALQALASRDDQDAWIYIEPKLFDADAEVRIAAIDALAVNEHEVSIHSLAGLLFDQDDRVRIHAVNAIGEIGGANASGYLEQLRYDPDPRVRASAIAILAELH